MILELSLGEKVSEFAASLSWTRAEIKLLERIYPLAPKEQILVALPHRSWKSIYMKAFRLRIKRQIYGNGESPFKGKKRPELSGPNNGMWGKHHTEEARDKQRRVWRYEKHFTPEARRKMGESRRGEKNPFYGKHWSDDEKQALRDKLKGRHLHPETEIKKGQRISPATEFTRERVQGWWKDPNYREKVIRGWLRQRRPTKPEAVLIDIISKYSLPFTYTGDGSFILEGLNPDFIECNGRKIAIDVFGDYWHTLKADRESYTEDGRKTIFAKYGWKLIVIWEHQIKSMDEKEIVQLLE